ncbi:DUF3159 domain-containing protein [Aeromicrobium wangtongii]|uniref:DUF3159 domain-containing protein n=1 Tax=Aeromicrobium wangtongii TaxID=2969247 RepID=A0ABY5MAJ6_9ACTN|nr:DUF3159 domain-containing protein [Aeromicrobium wangtongii]MCD9197665.1 DUF3159 domain-containing protein [Aeromicrobium wangtongii]UUP15150.1 DUF3159 domain-containing protein [Aeromicrobium wangtongii]
MTSAQATVEQVVRAQLAKALGGPRGIVESAVPTALFTICFLVSDDIRMSLIASIAVTAALLVVRLLQRSSTQFVLNALVGIGIGALFAYRASQSGGSEEDVARAVFTPGLIYNGAYAVVIVFTILIGWPIVGFMVGSVMGDATAWHEDKAMVRLCSRLTWVLAVPCVIRVVVQLPLWLDHQIGLLGASKIILGWPLQLAAFAVMAWLLTRNRTPIDLGPDPRRP